MKERATRLFISLLSTVAMLPSKLIWMKIGPQGKKDCGFNVPDICITGIDITGKDKGWWDIEFAWLFQMAIFAVFLFSSLLVLFGVGRRSGHLLLFNLALVLLFPFWMLCYCAEVIDNSDCATMDMTHSHVRLVVLSYCSDHAHYGYKEGAGRWSQRIRKGGAL